MLLPPDLRDWVPENHIVHFILDVVKTLPLEVYQLNWKGSGYYSAKDDCRKIVMAHQNMVQTNDCFCCICQQN